MVQGLLALIFRFAGGAKLILPLEKLMGPVPLAAGAAMVKRWTIC